MTDQEWAHIDSLLATWWKGEWTVQHSESYRLALDRFPAADVAKALADSLGAVRFRPAVSELYALLIPRKRTNEHPPPDAAWGLIQHAIRMVDRSVYAPDFHERHQLAIDWLADQDAVVAAFAALRGLCGPGSLGHAPVEDPDEGGKALGWIQKQYAAAVVVAQEREARGLPSVDPRQLQVRSTAAQSGGMADVVWRLRPSDQIGPGEAEGA